MTTPPSRLARWSSGLVFAAGCLAAAACLDLSRDFHTHHTGDTLIPSLMSLYKWEPFYWGQNRNGMLVPLVAAPVTDPFANLLVQNGLNILAGLAAVGVTAWYLSRDRGWPAAASAGAVCVLAGFGMHDRFQLLNGSQPYLLPLALGLGGVLVASPPGRWPGAGRAAAAVGLTLLAYWVNGGLAVAVAPLAAARFAAARWIDPPAAGGWVNRPGVREFAAAVLLTAVGTAAGRLMALPYPAGGMTAELAPIDDWPWAWDVMAWKVRERLDAYLWLVGGCLAVGAAWVAVPATRAAAVRAWAGVAAAVAGLVVQFLAVGALEWVQGNRCDPRYAYPGLVPVAPAAAAVALVPLAGLRPGRRLAVTAGLAGLMPAAVVALYGWPSPAAARAGVDHAAGRWTDDLLAAGCTHAVGDYWAVWPAVFHANMTLAERGDGRVVWGVAYRDGATADRWRAVPRDRTRLALVIRPGLDEPTTHYGETWEREFPRAVRVERRPTLYVLLPGDP